jgi:hypothetical protein
MRMIVLAAVILSGANGLGAQNLVEVLPAIVVCPLLDAFIHSVVNFATGIT